MYNKWSNGGNWTIELQENLYSSCSVSLCEHLFVPQFIIPLTLGFILSSFSCYGRTTTPKQHLSLNPLYPSYFILTFNFIPTIYIVLLSLSSYTRTVTYFLPILLYICFSFLFFFQKLFTSETPIYLLNPLLFDSSSHSVNHQIVSKYFPIFLPDHLAEFPFIKY